MFLVYHGLFPAAQKSAKLEQKTSCETFFLFKRFFVVTNDFDLHEIKLASAKVQRKLPMITKYLGKQSNKQMIDINNKELVETDKIRCKQFNESLQVSKISDKIFPPYIHKIADQKKSCHEKSISVILIPRLISAFKVSHHLETASDCNLFNQINIRQVSMISHKVSLNKLNSTVNYNPPEQAWRLNDSYFAHT